MGVRIPGDIQPPPPEGRITSLWAGIGGLGALTLGFALVPLRPITAASNLAFAFLILTIAVAELGGRGAGLVTAAMSALSLNFFLTRPYLTLHIEHADDLVAFLALAATGVIAAAFGRRRTRAAVKLDQVRHELEALDRLAWALTRDGGLGAALESFRETVRLGAVALRQADGGLVAYAPNGAPPPPVPTTELDPRTLLEAAGHQFRLGRLGFRLPEGGGRVPLTAEHHGPLWLDLWEGHPDGLTGDEQRAVTVAATMLSLALGRSAGTVAPARKAPAAGGAHP